MNISSQFAHKFAWIAILGLLVFMLAACDTGGSSNSTRTGNATPTKGGSKKTSAQPAGQVAEFALPPSAISTGGITRGPDGNLWFTEFQANQIGRITPTGTFTEFAVPPHGSLLSRPGDITAEPDGNFWFAEAPGNQMRRITIGK